MENQQPFSSIAIIGLGAIFPGSDSAQEFWRNIINSRDLITDVPPSHWLIADYYDPDPRTPDKTYCKRGAFLKPVEFNPMEYGVPPTNLSQTDTTQLLSLVAMKQVLIDAFGQDFEKISLKTASVILGITSAQELCAYASARLQHPIWRKALREAGIPPEKEDEICQRISDSYAPWGESMFPGLLGNVVSGRIANRFNFGGTNCVVDAACASSLSALSMAIDELQLGRSDLAITGGADTMNDIFMFMCFSKTPALSMSGDCRPFSKTADGTILGEGLGFMALRRLADAERDGNSIYAVIRGIGSSSDGRSKSVYAPVPEGQALAINRCYASAGISPSSVELIEAHGTGTVAGDAAEIAGLKQAFANASSDRAQPWCAIGSIKSQIGHTKAAAGAAALVKTLLALRHKTLAPTIKIDEPNPKLGLENSPFYLNTQTRPWIANSPHPRRAGVSAFGFGGTNFHVALEEYRGPGKLAGRLRSLNSELILLSASSPTTLLEKIRAMAAQPQSLAYIAKHSQQQFNAQDHSRLAIIAHDEQDLAAKLTQASDDVSKNASPSSKQADIFYRHGQTTPGKVAFLFPGQGSQYPNMGGELLTHFDSLQAIWEEIAAIPLDPQQRLQDIIYPLPAFDSLTEKSQENALAQTEWTQPALAATSLVYLHLLQSLGIQADCYAGHSFGELVALHAAGVFDQSTLLQLARTRGQLMKQAGKTPGAMTAVISADMAQIFAQIDAGQLAVVAANYNCPQQTVFSGSQTAITDFEAKLQAQAISFHRLPVSSAFHSRLIEDAYTPFFTHLSGLQFNSPRQPVYANATAQAYPEEPLAIRQLLANQLINPVRFVEQINAMYQAGVRTFIEVGPQGILTNFTKKILADQAIQAIALDLRKQSPTSHLWQALGELAVAGIAINFTALWQDYVEPKARETQQAKYSLPISGSNYGKPYPPPAGSQDDPAPQLLADSSKDATAAVESPQAEERKAIMSNYDNERAITDERMHEDNIRRALELYSKLQEEITQAHREHQELSEKTHMAYLEEAKAAMDDIRDILSEAGHHPPPALPVNAILDTLQIAPKNTSAATAAPALATTAAMPIEQPVPAPTIAPVAMTAEPTAEDLALQNTMLAIVAEKTGYPQETLDMNMELEADLGIDSIKRVEILSAMQSKVANLPALNPTELASLRSFAEIAAYIKKQQGA